MLLHASVSLGSWDRPGWGGWTEALKEHIGARRVGHSRLSVEVSGLGWAWQGWAGTDGMGAWGRRR